MSTGLWRVTIERKSMHSLERDFTKYIGDAEQLADEALFGIYTVTSREGPARATARSQQEAQFFAKLLKRDLPSATHFLVVSPEVRVTYVPFSSPPESQSAHSVHSSKSPEGNPERDSPTPTVDPSPGSHESSCTASSARSTSEYTPPPETGINPSVVGRSFDSTEDTSPQDDSDVSDDPAQHMDHIDWYPQHDTFAQGYEGFALGIQQQGPSDADFTFGNGVEDFMLPSADGWYHPYMSMQEGDGDGISPGGAGIDIDIVQPCQWSYGSVASRLGCEDVYTGTRASFSIPHIPGQYWAGDVACDRPHILLEAVNTGDPGLSLNDSAVVASEEFHPETAGSWKWTQLDGVGAAALTVSMPSDDSDAGCFAPVGYPASYGYPEALSARPSCHHEGDRGSSSVTLDENVEHLGGTGESEAHRRLWGDMDTMCHPVEGLQD
ncbi:hypothetical protein LXA43DRAFT_1018736 [Ganoderma leucocontextum]|nr:hypothetical protein LXA43DRAFT_1018736 [Ganoderma leucocontextum]